MVTFKYLTRNIIDSLNRFQRENENAFLGVAVCSVIELLGRCVRNPKDTQNGYQNFQRFISDYLSKEDPRYRKYEYIIYQDLRHGSAHAVLPKGGVSLSYDSDSEYLHLDILKSKNDPAYHCLWLYSPRLIHDLKSSIYKFVEDARGNRQLENNYVETLQQIQQEGQELIKNNISRDDFNKAIEIKMQGDIVV